MTTRSNNLYSEREMTWCIYHILMCEPIDVPLPNVSWMLDLKCLKAGTFLSSCFHLWEWQLSRDDNSFSTVRIVHWTSGTKVWNGNIRKENPLWKEESSISTLLNGSKLWGCVYPGVRAKMVACVFWCPLWQTALVPLLLFVLFSKHESLEFILVIISAL